MAKLILVRHGTSEYNVKGLWTGLTDVDLDESGQKDAEKMADLIKQKDLKIDKVYTSALKRAQHTYQIIKEKNQLVVEPIVTKDMNERDYGDYTGKNKWEVQKEVGEEAFQKLRRSWDYPVPNGETMKAVYERVVPFFEKTVLPELKQGNNVLIAAHGNSLRALIKYLDQLSEDQLSALEFGIGEVYIYDFDSNGNITNKTLLGENPNKGKV